MPQQTYPRYDTTPANLPAWQFGSGRGYASHYSGLPGTTVSWYAGWSKQLPLTPGTYYLDAAKVTLALAGDANCDAVWFAVWSCETDGAYPNRIESKPDGSQWLEDVTADKPAENVSAITTWNLSGDALVIEEGREYYYGIIVHGKDGRSTSTPGIRRFALNEGPTLRQFRGHSANFADLSSLAVEEDGTYQNNFALQFRTANRILIDVENPTAGKYEVPRRIDSGVTQIQLVNAVVEDGEALTMKTVFESGTGTATDRDTLVLDMGETDQVTFKTLSVPLNATTTEAGDDFDILFQVRTADNTGDVFYQNKTTGQGAESTADLATFSHAVKEDGNRGASHTVYNFDWLNLSGTFTCDRLRVGCEPLVLFGDSQGAYFAAPLPAAFSHERMVWRAYIGGNKLASTSTGNHTAGYLRYKHTTPGLGDLCEMHDVVFCFTSFAVNDVQGIGTTEANRNGVACRLLQRMAEILDDLQSNNNIPLLIGIPPYSSAVNTSTQEAKTIQHQINPGIAAIAKAARCACYIPWDDMVAPDTIANDVPTFKYSSDSGTHYSTAGATYVSAEAARALEAGIAADLRTPSNSARPPRTTSQDLDVLLRNHTTADRIQHHHDGTWSVLNESGEVIYRGTQKEVWNHLERTAP